MALLNKKLKGSTLVEALTAMVIVMLALGVFTTIYVNVMKSGDRQRKVQAGLLLDKIAMETKRDQLFLDAEFKTEEFVIQKRVSPYSGGANLFSLTLEAFDKNKKLLSVRNELIFTK